MKYFFTSIGLFLLLNVYGQFNPATNLFSFVENKGQILDQNGQSNDEVLFLHSNGKGINTQFHSNGISYDLFHRSISENNSTFIFDRIDIEFIGMNEEMEIVPIEQNSAVSNFYRRSSNNESINAVHSYKSVLYSNVYPNIDIIFKTMEDGLSLKYDFILHPGADLSNIRLRYKGAETIDLFDGQLRIKTHEKQFTEKIPMSWYREDGQEVKINFTILNKSDSFVDVGMAGITSLSSNQTLIIDPMPALVWAKYIGDSLKTTTNGVITDRFGNIYICGGTQSLSQIATSGAYQTMLMDSISDAYVSKYNTTGVQIWSTYFGGNLEDVANDVYVDTTFNVFLAGTTFSDTLIADSLSYQDTIAGSSDAFLAKFNMLGELQWSTYIGGDSTDFGIRLSTDFNQNVYLGGTTNSPSGIASDSAYQTVLSGSFDGFVSKFDSLGNLVWSTYIGGLDADLLSGISFGDTTVYICGQTFSSDFPTNGLFSQDSLNGINDGFIAGFTPDGNLNWSTYFGGEDQDEAKSIKVFNNNIYFTGTTNSINGIALPGAYQPIKADSIDAFIAKMNNAGNLVWSSYFGGDSIDQGVDLFFELDSNLFVLGSTNSTNLQLDSANTFQADLAGSTDAFLTKFTKDGMNVWTSYYGGPDSEIPEAIAVYGNTGIYVVGTTHSDTMIVPDQMQDSLNSYNSDQEGFFTKFRQAASTGPSGVWGGGSGMSAFCPGTLQMLTIQGGDLGTDADWIWYEGTCGSGPTIGTGDTIYVSPTQTTIYSVRAESITNVTACVSVIINVISVVPISIISDTTTCTGSDYTLSASGSGMFEWTGPNNFFSTNASTTISNIDSTYQGWYFLEFTDSNGCVQHDSLNLQIGTIPEIQTVIDQISCFNQTDGSIYLSCSDSLTWIWNVAVSDPDSLTNLSQGTYIYTATNAYNCSVSDTIEIVETQQMLVDTLVENSGCLEPSGVIILYLDSLSDPYSINWNPIDSANDTITQLSEGIYEVSIESPNGCIETYSFSISVENSPVVEITESNNVSCPGMSDGYAIAEGSGGTLPYIYSWSPNGLSGQLVDSLDSGIYIVTLTDSLGCTAFDTIAIDLNSDLEINSSITASFCSFPSGMISLSVSDPGTMSSIVWSCGIEGSLTVSNLEAGNYNVQMTDIFGCEYLFEFDIPTINDLSALINPGDTIIPYGESIDLTALTNYSGNFIYNWSPDGNFNCTNCEMTTVTPTQNQTYQLIVDGENGCIDTAYITIQLGRPCIELFIPEIFSPNGDNLNDRWEFIGTCITSIQTVVYNQWGEEIFSSDNQSNSWDGSFKNEIVPNDQYAYIVIVVLEDGSSEIYNGSVRVIY